MKLRNEELEDFKNFLEKKGYKRFSGHFNNEDYGYWKSFDITKDENGDSQIGYQIAILFYDWNKYNEEELKGTIGIQLEAIINNVRGYERLDIMGVTEGINLESWEEDIKFVVRKLGRNNYKKSSKFKQLDLF